MSEETDPLKMKEHFMATFAELQKRLRRKTPKSQLSTDEVLVADIRGGLSPATMVDKKLRAALAVRGRRERPALVGN